MPTGSAAQTALLSVPERGDAARKKLIGAGLKIFSEAGYEGASTRSLAAAAGVNVAAIPYYFQSKEGLYLAVIDYIIEYFRKGLGEGLAKIRRALAEKEMSGAGYRALLDEFMHIFLHFVLQENTERWQISHLYSREQLDPTSAFDRLYEGFSRELHETLAGLVAAIVGPQVTASEVKLVTQTLLGQVSSFKLSRGTVLHNLGWKNYREGVDEIERVLMFQRNVIMQAYRREGRRS